MGTFPPYLIAFFPFSKLPSNDRLDWAMAFVYILNGEGPKISLNYVIWYNIAFCLPFGPKMPLFQMAHAHKVDEGQYFDIFWLVIILTGD